MPIVRFPKFKRSLRLARDQAAKQSGEQLARAISRLEAPHRDLIVRLVDRLDPGETAPGPTAPARPCPPDPPPDPPE